MSIIPKWLRGGKKPKQGLKSRIGKFQVMPDMEGFPRESNPDRGTSDPHKPKGRGTKKNDD